MKRRDARGAIVIGALPLCHNRFHRAKRKEARSRRPLRRVLLRVLSAVTTAMMPLAAMPEADRLELQAGDTGRDIQSGLAHAWLSSRACVKPIGKGPYGGAAVVLGVTSQ